VLDNILRLWLSETDIIREDVEPRAALEQYLRIKMRFSRLYPNASKVFANEIIHGAGEIGPFLRSQLRALVDGKTRVFEHWIHAGRIAPIDPRNLFFAMWAVTQTYADFDAQVRAVLGVTALSERQFEHATEEVVGLILRGCGYFYVTPDGRADASPAQTAVQAQKKNGAQG
jgi:TetR/AcrR family transcriptional regulator